MYDELVKRLRDHAICADSGNEIGNSMYLNILKAADAIEELTAIAESYKRSMEAWADEAADAIEELSNPRWVPVTEALPESVDDDVLVTDGEGYAVGYWRPDAQAWDSTDFGWLENRSEPPCGIHTVTHWMSLPPLPEPPKEEEQ